VSAADAVAAIDTALRALAPAHVQVGARAIDAADEARLHPDEAAIVAGAVAKRRREFASGRALLRSLLGSDGPVTVLATRAPAVPAGVVASLAHDDELAVAAVSTDARVVALGVDVEPEGAVDGEVADVVLRPEERDLDPTWVFVVKEAVYKAWSTTGGRILGHDDVRVTPGADGAFTAMVLDAHREFTGSSARVGGRVVALVVDARQDGCR
jgi:4'-phosphopantetheinyl transferase EntD